MGLSALSRAQLLHILARLPAAEWPAATAAAGFESRPERPRQFVGEYAGSPLWGAKSQPPAPEPYQPSNLPDQPFWRIAGRRRLRDDEWPGGAPALMGDAEPWEELPESNPDIPVPEQQPLVPRSRRARFLRRQLASARHGAAIDLDRLCRQLAERQLPARLPRLLRPTGRGGCGCTWIAPPICDPFTPTSGAGMRSCAKSWVRAWND